MEEKQLQDELTSIRSLMERSSKFISLSGLSGILAGIYALIGAGFIYYIITPVMPYFPLADNQIITFTDEFWGDASFITVLVLVGLLVLIASVATCVLLSRRKAKKKGQPAWSKSSRLMLFNMAVPLITGAAIVLILISKGYYGIIAPGSLIFYGLALLGASNFTFGDVKYLAILEIILGLVAALLPVYGLVFWAIGFGVLHIIYGSIMYFKYDG
ncbi:MAG: hypothetical protein EOP47_28190 [Sphingobacteriaceae bacterium]|nr:MAG: hypothetical protein EOP47_28190 [Sphingobacteriaceae bacterium]